MTTQNPNREAMTFSRYILSSLDRMVQCLDGLNEEQLNWRPSAPNANSLYALTVHTLGNAEENILALLAGQPVERNREQEFLARGSSSDDLSGHWQGLRERLEQALLALTNEDLEREITHPRRGVLIGREILIIVARHAAEHLGQAELTKDLLFSTNA